MVLVIKKRLVDLIGRCKQNEAILQTEEADWQKTQAARMQTAELKRRGAKTLSPRCALRQTRSLKIAATRTLRNSGQEATRRRRSRAPGGSEKQSLRKADGGKTRREREQESSRTKTEHRRAQSARRGIRKYKILRRETPRSERKSKKQNCESARMERPTTRKAERNVFLKIRAACSKLDRSACDRTLCLG